MDLEKLKTIKKLAEEIQQASQGQVKKKAKMIEKLTADIIKDLEQLTTLEMFL